MDDLDEMGRELMRDLELLTKRFLLPAKTSDLTRSETALLRYLADHPRSTMSDVSAGLGIALSSATGVVDVLVDRKLVERMRPEHDRRTVVVGLTSRGQKMHDDFVRDRSALAAGMLEPLTKIERKELLALFRKMTRDVE